MAKFLPLMRRADKVTHALGFLDADDNGERRLRSITFQRRHAGIAYRNWLLAKAAVADAYAHGDPATVATASAQANSFERQWQERARRLDEALRQEEAALPRSP